MSEDLEKSAVDTPSQEAETVAEQGTVDLDKEDTTKVETEPQEEMVSKAELERILKEKDQVEKRKNQLENQLEKAQQAAQSAGNEELVNQLQAELDAYKQEREEEELQRQLSEFDRELSGVFDAQLENYPEEIKAAARVLKDKTGIRSIIGDAQYSFQAEKNIKSFLDDLSEGLKVISKPEIKVDATNPSITPPQTEKTLLESELAKPESQRDFSSIIGKRLGKRM